MKHTPSRNDHLIEDNCAVTVVILCSPSPKHPDIAMISDTLNSLRYLDNYDQLQVIISHDFPHPKSSTATFVSYKRYLESLKDMVAARPEITVIESKSFGHLKGNICNSLEFVRTKYVLFVQHDLKFTAQIDLTSCVAVMENKHEIKHIRFNKNINQPTVWDKDPPHRQRFFKEITFNFPKGEFNLIKTLGWSDNNHLTTTSYYRQIVLPMIGKRKTFPENILNITSGVLIGRFLGNYIYGGINHPPVIAHLDGRSIKQETNVSKSQIKGSLSKNRERIKVGILRMYYKVKIWVVLVLRFRKSNGSRLQPLGLQ